MSRPIWKGFITFGLVNIPVVLYSAEKKQGVQFKLVDSRDKAKIHYERINERTGREVPWKDVAKGYEYDENNYILVNENDLKSIAGENSKTIDIECFVDKNSLDTTDFDKPYYLVPDKKGEKGYVILHETLKDTKKVGIARVFIHTRQYLAALMPYEDMLLLNLLRYHQEIRKTSEFDLPSMSLKAHKITTKEMEVAKQLVASMTEKWNPAKFKNEYQQKLHDWIEERVQDEGKPRKRKKSTVAEPKKTNVVNFVDILKKSLEAKKHQKSSTKKARKTK